MRQTPRHPVAPRGAGQVDRRPRDTGAPRSLAAVAVLIAAVSATAGCYGARHASVASVHRLSGPVVGRIVLDDRSRVRGLILPSASTRDAITYRPAVYSEDDWEIRASGWPAVYSSGRFWRREHYPETVTLSSDEIEAVYIEEVDWFPTVVTLPLSLPGGIIDFIARNAQLGFDAVNVHFDEAFREDPPRRPPSPEGWNPDILPKMPPAAESGDEAGDESDDAGRGEGGDDAEPGDMGDGEPARKVTPEPGS